MPETCQRGTGITDLVINQVAASLAKDRLDSLLMDNSDIIVIVIYIYNNIIFMY